VAENGQAVLNQTRTNNKANEITGIQTAPEQTQWAVPEYDARGNMITMPKPDSPASAMVCVYDAWNRMVQARNSDGGVIATYRYDGLTRRIRKIVAGSPEVTYDYYHNPARQILETRKNGSANPYEQHVWGLRYVHAPVLRWRDENTDGEDIETLYYCNDANFNVTALVNTIGTVVERYTYDPYGKVTFRAADWSERASSAYENDVLFTGHRLDTETGLYYGGWRYYHPTLGLWISREMEGWYLDEINLYTYCLSMPQNLVDPDGQRPIAIDPELDNPHYIEEQERKAQWDPDPNVKSQSQGMFGDMVEGLADLLPLDSICDKALGETAWLARLLYKGCDPAMKGEGEFLGWELGLGGEAYVPWKVPAGGGVGLGIQNIVLCDTCQYCCYFFGKVKAGLGGGAAGGVSVSGLHGKGAKTPKDYEKYSAGVEVSAGPLFVGGSWGEEAKVVEGGVQATYPQAASVAGKLEYYKLIKCRALFE